MPYIGRSTDGFGVRNRFLYLASASDTSVSGADANGATLTFTDGAYVDVYLNGVLLKAGTDYNTNTANTIAGLSALAANDEVTVIVYDIFAVADTVSQSSGGTFSGAITFDSTVSGLDVNGTEIILDADGDTTITADTDDTIDIKIGGSDIFQMTASKLDLNGKELVLDADADTSITADTDDRIDFKTAGSDRMKINSNGSVGIGTATTTGDLNISPVVGSYTTIQMTSGGATTGNIIYFGDSTDADYSSITAFGSNAGESGRMRFIAGTNEAMNIYNTGAVTKPNNPMWWAYNNSNQNIANSSAGSYETFVFNTESYDIGSGYNTSNGRYVAPIAGKYYVNTKLLMQGLNSNTTYYVDLIIAVSGSQKLRESMRLNVYPRAQTISVSGLVHCAANDYIEVQLRLENVSNTVVYAAQTTAYFQGFLVG